MTQTKRHSFAHLVVAIIGVFTAAFALFLFNQHVLMTFSLPIRMVLMIITQWSLFLVPGILLLVNDERFVDLGFSSEKIPTQVIIGILIAIVMSLILTVLPILLGFKEMVGNTEYSESWQFIYQFIYATFGVALAEELVFRGFIFRKLLEIRDSRWLAIIVSSLLFGLFHIFNGNIIQLFVTALIGFLYCIFREKVRSCTLLSLIIAHGIYDGLIVLWVSVL